MKPVGAMRPARSIATLAVAVTVALTAGACSSSNGAAKGSGASPAHPAASGQGRSTTTVSPVTLQATPAAWQLPSAVSRPVVLPDGRGFVILGGLASGDVSTSRIVQVDPVAGTSQLAGHLALAVHDSAGAFLAGRALVFGGGSYSTVSEVQSWTAGTASRLGRLPQARSDLSAVTVGGTAYIAGGFDGTTMTPDVLATSDGVTYRSVATLDVPVRYAAVAVAGQTLWVVGGVTSTSEGGTAETDAIQKVDLTTGQVTVAGHLPQAMGHATAVTLDGSVFVIGGRSGTVPSAAIWRVDPASGTVEPAGHLPEALSDAGSVVVGGTGYLVGGEVTGPTAPLDTVVELRPGS